MASYIALYTSLESCSFIRPKMVHAYLSYFSCTHFVALGVHSAYRHPKNIKKRSTHSLSSSFSLSPDLNDLAMDTNGKRQSNIAKYSDYN